MYLCISCVHYEFHTDYAFQTEDRKNGIFRCNDLSCASIARYGEIARAKLPTVKNPQVNGNQAHTALGTPSKSGYGRI